MAESNNLSVSTDSSRTEETTEIHSEMAGTADDASLQRFLQQQLSDRMHELEQIQNSERPVTGQANRDRIAHFMAKHSQEPAGAGTKDNVPANVDAVEEHRPDAVVVEVQGVVEQRRVSSMLQSPHFRRNLENIIRGSISSARQSNAAQATARTRAANSPRPNTPVFSAAAAAAAAARSRSSSQETVASSVEDVPAASEPTIRASSPAVPRPRPVQQEPVEPRLGVWEPVHTAPVAGEVQGLWSTISQVHHEEMVQEISELVHRGLVSSTLSSQFHSVMELHVANHINRQETNGEAVADYVRSIPQSGAHIPNDFSHLGIPPVAGDDNSDNISITGISASAVPYTQTNLHLSREMRSLKAQMEEMKNMLRLSFDLQMDTQRAIRQEVAAALASVTAQGATAVPVVRSTPVNDAHCLICLDNHSDSVLYQCGHMCVCYTCGKNLITVGNGKCPVCRAPIKDVIRAYKTNAD